MVRRAASPPVFTCLPAAAQQNLAVMPPSHFLLLGLLLCSQLHGLHARPVQQVLRGAAAQQWHQGGGQLPGPTGEDEDKNWNKRPIIGILTQVILLVFACLLTVANTVHWWRSTSGKLKPLVLLSTPCPLTRQAGLDEDKFVPANGTYIASSYVKFVESGGARVVPILADTPADVVSTW